MTFLLISPKNRTVYNFRGDLIKEIIKRGYHVVVTGPDLIDVDKITALGAEFVEIPMNKTGTNIISDIKYCASLFKLMKRIKPTITLGYTVKPVVYGAIAAKLAGIKNINSMITGGGYTFTAKTVKAKVLGMIVRMLYRCGLGVSTHVIFQNKDDMEEFVCRGLVRNGKCSVVNGSGVNIAHFAPKGYPDSISFFMLARLLKSKGVQEYLEAAEMVKQLHPGTKFYLLGKYEDKMQDAMPKEFVEDYINRGIVHRFDETDDVRPYYEMASVYVLPSYREGTPRTVLEAMAMGRAVITTDAPGCRETVINELNGYLVPVADATELSKAMQRFICNPELVERMGANSRKYAAEKFDVELVNKSLLKIMEI